MPRATRYLQEGFIYHLTHRCHDAQFFLRFSKERNVYREWLRIGVQRYGVPVLGYNVTCNHVHVVAEVQDRYAVADMMKLAAGVVAQKSHRRKGHEGSVWEHPYHCTRIQDGKHLLNCLRYVDLNMVRTRKVKHPCEWRWCGYDELTGARRRYRIVDQERLLHCTGIANMGEFCVPLGSDHGNSLILRLLTSVKRAVEPVRFDFSGQESTVSRSGLPYGPHAAVAGTNAPFYAVLNLLLHFAHE